MGLHVVNIALNSLWQIKNGSELCPLNTRRIFDGVPTCERA